jgi:hypothetical protein
MVLSSLNHEGRGVYSKGVRKGRYILVFLLLGISVMVQAVESALPEKPLPSGVHVIKDTQRTKTCDSDGFLQQEIVHDRAGEFRWAVEYQYDQNGRLLQKEARNREGDLLWRILFSFDTSGRPERETHYNEHAEPEYTLVHEYRQERMETFAYDRDGSVLWRSRRLRDLERGVQETSFYYPDGSRIKAIIESFGSWGQVVEETHIDEIGAVYRRIETEYDEFGRQTGRTVYNHRGEIHRRTWISYLPHGHVGTIRQIMPQESRITSKLYRYVLDKRGAWLEREELITVRDEHEETSPVEKGIEIREITYHQREGEE